MNFFTLAKIRRPSSTAVTIVAKSSLTRIIVAASRATLVPLWPIATPMSARRSAGASLAPSPVMATVSPCAHERDGRVGRLPGAKVTWGASDARLGGR